MNYILHLAIFYAIYVAAALGLNLVMGYMGRISLAHAGYVAIGGYTYAIVTSVYKFNFLIAFSISIAIGSIFSLLLSLPAWRFKGDFFVMISLAVQALIYGTINNWHTRNAAIGSFKNLTNGSYGISDITKPHLLGCNFETLWSIFVIYAVILGIVFMFFSIISKSPWGRLLECMRDDELALQGFGKPVRRLKIEAFAISGGVTALAGAMYAAYVSYIDPSTASLDDSILWLSVVVVGGLGTLRGSFLGGAIVLLIPEVLRFLPLPLLVAANIRYLAYGLLILLMLHLRPNGLLGKYQLE